MWKEVNKFVQEESTWSGELGRRLRAETTVGARRACQNCIREATRREHGFFFFFFNFRGRNQQDQMLMKGPQ